MSNQSRIRRLWSMEWMARIRRKINPVWQTKVAFVLGLYSGIYCDQNYSLPTMKDPNQLWGLMKKALGLDSVRNRKPSLSLENNDNDDDENKDTKTTDDNDIESKEEKV